MKKFNLILAILAISAFGVMNLIGEHLNAALMGIGTCSTIFLVAIKDRSDSEREAG